MSAAENAALRNSIARELELRDAVASAAPRRGEREPFNAAKVSPSRINSYLSCGVAFKMNYIDRLPQQASGSAALRGSVIHLALERWAPDRSKNLEGLMRQAWVDFNTKDGKPNVIAQFLRAYSGLSGQAQAKEQEIRDKWARMGKESKAPRMTKDWKESAIGRKLRQLSGEWYERLNRESFYRFSEYDPLPALYDESLVLAQAYEKRFHRLPAPLMTEFHINEPWRGFTLDCYVDTVEPVYDADGELSAILILDYKTYKAVPAPLKDYRQVVMYDAGLRSLVARGAVGLPTDVPWYVGVDYVCWTPSWKHEDGTPHPPRKAWKVTEEDLTRLESELSQYRRAIEANVFLPAEKGRKPDFCDYPENCCLKNCTAAGGGLTEVVL